ncbi:molecular chaperone HtpG [Sinanaerobacter sp. ZZT-01]|uniref:molecular chaperone HtpG n=1 Tax=Sinanaerobacter sp. ZZT-01 TaxID=3111540 RepID=UPI002D77B0B9|nr:molecular chaperone HtpG [Sinanaerobacter sp. ZZT-01]WRR93305.1 molecular chaperone HtpG [Sinanaerobacter sp. ZZT-01]
MAKKQFKAESKRLLDLMINSIYTHKEIFLRELISNSSDAIDKLYYRALQENNTGFSREDFAITIELNKEERTLKISDNGIGMTKDELEQNLGTIAKSGSLAFKKENEPKDEIDIIGQFGVGFYSAFMVSERVTVISKAFGEATAYRWESTGADGYNIGEYEKESNGTEIILNIKQNTEDENYDEFLENYRIQGLIKRYSDYIRYPIQMMMEKHHLKEGTEDEYEDYKELETLNSMVPIWKKNKSELTDEDYHAFYKEKFHDFTDPAKVIHTNVEGVSTYNALLFIPVKAPFNYYTKDYEKGLQLYSSGVLIMEKCADLLPDYFSFVRGLVDSQDLSLNISREMLQHDRQLKSIASRLEKKIKSELLAMLNTDREKYDAFFESFGLQLKYGLYDGFGANKDTLKDLVLFYSSSEKKMVTLSEYVSRCKADQKYIYYASGENVDRIDKLPQIELLKDKGYEILYLTADIDEFALQMLHDFDGKDFKSASSGDLELEESEEEKEAAQKQTEENKELLEFMKETLGDKVSEVRLSQRLKTHPVCLSSAGELSLEMEKVINALPNEQKIKADRVLEINAKHSVLEALKQSYMDDKEKAKIYTELLYNQALLIEGFTLDDPVAFSNSICSLIV